MSPQAAVSPLAEESLLQSHVIIFQHETSARIFLDEVFVNGSSNHTLEHTKIDFRTIACSVLLKILHISRHHVNGELRHFQIFLVEGISRCYCEKVHELLQSMLERYTGIFRERRGFDELLAEFEKVLIHILAETITLPVLQKRLLTLKADFLSQCESVLILHTLLLVSGMKPDVEVEVFFSCGNV